MRALPALVGPIYLRELAIAHALDHTRIGEEPVEVTASYCLDATDLIPTADTTAAFEVIHVHRSAWSDSPARPAPAAPAAGASFGQRRNASALATGVYPHTSKYNPFRAYVVCSRLKRQVYLGAFPTLEQAQAARSDYLAGRPVLHGTKGHARHLHA